MSIGTIHPPESMFLRVSVGSATDPDTDELAYEMDLANASTPLITSALTGKKFSLSWQEMIELAQAAGIDEVEKEESDGTS